MIEATGAPLPVLALVWPLALACVAGLPPVRGHAIRLLPLAPLPAAWLALTGARERTLLPDLLLGVALETVPAGALMLALTAGLWFAAGLFAQSYMADTRKPAVFAAFWCLTLCGNLGVFLAADVITFYVAFATVSLAAYVLIVHDGTEEALHAGRVYVTVVVLGEVCLLAAFVIGIAAANGSLGIADIRAALPEAPLGGLAAALLVAGFGIKAGLMPLHIWLPLAHPAAPTPASAVLSGAIVKAGIIGMILFLPSGLGFAGWIVALGFAGAFAGALLGLVQTNPKTILAYSTVSQMSLVTALIAAASDSANNAPTALYAVHHGLAKGGLFLAVGLAAASGGPWRGATLAAAGLVALSVAGAPLTGGSVVKLAAKSGLAGPVETALSLSAITTAMVLTWFVIRLALAESHGAGRPRALLALPTLALGLAALAVPWLLAPGWSDLEPGYPLHLAPLWSTFWPVAAGVAAVLVWSAHRPPISALRGRGFAASIKDLLTAVRQSVHAAAPAIRIAPVPTAARARVPLAAAIRTANALDRHLRRGTSIGLLLAVFCIAVALGGGLWR